MTYNDGKPFKGVVMLRNWLRAPWNVADVGGIAGMLSIRSSEEMIGFRTHAPDVNWGILVEGEILKEWIPGCEVQGVIDCSHPSARYNLRSEVVELP